MQPTIPAPIQAYFDAANAQDADRTLACFAPDARIEDEGETLSDPAAIRAWRDRVAQQYQPVSNVKAVARDGDAYIVTASVAGTFPGSPIDLDYRFVLAGERIGELSIA